MYPNDFPTGNDPQKSAGLLPGAKPAFDRTAKPSLSYMEGALRTVRIPDDTMRKFLEVARTNTARNVETCGILAGQLKQHQLLVTHVILPKQSGTSDSCNTMNEEEIFDIQDQLVSRVCLQIFFIYFFCFLEPNYARLDPHASVANSFPQLGGSSYASWLPNNDARGELIAAQ